MTSESRIVKRVAELIDDMLEETGKGLCEVTDVPERTLARVRSKDCRNMTLRTLVRVFDALGYELVVNARKK